jgi:hypothetical protein
LDVAGSVQDGNRREFAEAGDGGVLENLELLCRIRVAPFEA